MSGTAHSKGAVFVVCGLSSSDDSRSIRPAAHRPLDSTEFQDGFGPLLEPNGLPTWLFSGVLGAEFGISHPRSWKCRFYPPKKIPIKVGRQSTGGQRLDSFVVSFGRRGVFGMYCRGGLFAIVRIRLFLW
jgi:hypothetical protein